MWTGAPVPTVAPALTNVPVLTGAYVDLASLLALRAAARRARRRGILRSGPRVGARESKLRGRGVDFAEVRLYQPSDDVRTIEWRVTARKNKPHTKVFREERERPVLVVVDQTQSMFFGSRGRLKSVAGAEFGASTAWQALAHNDRVGGIVIGNTQTASRKPLRSVKAISRLLGDLATQNQALNRRTRLQDGAHYRESLGQIRRLVRTGFHVVMISDFLTAPEVWRRTVQALARHNDLTLVRVADRLERELPPTDRYTVTDGQARSQFHSGDPNLRRAHASCFDQREEDLRSLCTAWTVRYIPLMTDEACDGVWM